MKIELKRALMILIQNWKMAKMGRISCQILENPKKWHITIFFQCEAECAMPELIEPEPKKEKKKKLRENSEGFFMIFDYMFDIFQKNPESK